MRVPNAGGRRWAVGAALAAALTAFGTACHESGADGTSREEVSRAPATGACETPFDPARASFPVHVAPTHAKGFAVAYHRHHKVVTLDNPWGDGRDYRYMLVPCGAPRPQGYDDATVIEVPVRRAITTSTTELPAFVMLGEVDRLVGHATFAYVFAPEVRARMNAGHLAEVGAGGTLDVERVIAAEPDVLFADTLGSPEFDTSGLLGVLQAADVPVVVVPSFLETTPLGRAEWLKYLAVFFDREAEANALFDDIASHYDALATAGRSARDRPTVITGGPAGDTWHVPGGRSFAAQLLADAGFDYRFADDDRIGSIPLSFEAVHAVALDADWWIRPRRWASRQEILAADGRLGQLAAFRAGRIVTIDARMNANGGNDYWETGTARPDWVLADLLSLAHPELVPDHVLRFHRIVRTDLGG